MKRVLSQRLPSPGCPVQLPETEGDHLVRVLRLRDGDVIEALDGQGHSALVTLRLKGGDVPHIEFLESPPPISSQEEIPPVELEIALLKGDAMEWVIEKAVELGVRTLIPTLTAHTVVQIKNKGPEAFRERWQKIADQALKQCGRLERMEVELPTPLQKLLQARPAESSSPRLWFDEAGRSDGIYLPDWLREHRQLSSARILVGPEGGWSDSERELLGAEVKTSALFRVGLGPWVLRAETAAIFATSLATSHFRAKSLTKIDR